jgi:Fe-Mn family superoxide dismutase
VELPPLPYAYDALQPHISERTLRFHHDKHHAKYVDNTNALIKGTSLEGSDIVTILKQAHSSSNDGLFNNAAQSYNHDFYWNCMKSNGGGRPKGKMAKLIDQKFGSYEKFRAEFVGSGMKVFGSGW